MDPSAFRFAGTHEWVQIDGDIATVGISDFAVKALTDLVYVDLPASGSRIEAGTTFGEVESVKAVSDLYAPVSGEIVEVNESLPDDLDSLSEDAFGRGWMIRIRMSAPDEVQKLLDYDAYVKHCESESH